MTTILFKNMSQHIRILFCRIKEKSVCFAKKMDEVRAMNKIEVDLSQEKIDLIMLIRKNYLTGKRQLQRMFEPKMKQKKSLFDS